MDVYPRPRKLSGAHMAGYAYDVHPYVLMNYNDDYESVTTLAHEWGHAMHSYLANKAQPFVTSNYATFIAEIASTFNEALLLDHVLKTAKTDDERLLYLGSALERLRGTFFRQAMFARVRAQHPRAGRQGRAADRRGAHQDLLRDPASATTAPARAWSTIDDVYCVEWAYIPHFYNALLRLPVRDLDRRELAVRADASARASPARCERYLDLLKAGGSGLSVRAGEDGGRRPRDAGAVPGAGRRG